MVSQTEVAAAVMQQVVNAALVGHDGASAPSVSLLVTDAFWSWGSVTSVVTGF